MQTINWKSATLDKPTFETFTPELHYRSEVCLVYDGEGMYMAYRIQPTKSGEEPYWMILDVKNSVPNFDTDTTGTRVPGRVSHWMPLPNFPDESF